MKTKAFIEPPERIPFYIKIGLLISKKVTKKDLLAPKLLAWYPKVAVSSGVLESLVAHGKRDLNERILKLVRIQSSMIVACSFCIDMNSFEYENFGITDEEMQALGGKTELDNISSFSEKERLAIEYSRLISQTPVVIPEEFINRIKSEFNEREIVILSSTAAQVNYWARMLKALGVPPAGFSDRCSIN
ncbi:MAG: carboxymuconolactone decarboxylase family protein [Clostridiaceae bacterium]